MPSPATPSQVMLPGVPVSRALIKSQSSAHGHVISASRMRTTCLTTAPKHHNLIWEAVGSGTQGKEMNRYQVISQVVRFLHI